MPEPQTAETILPDPTPCPHCGESDCRITRQKFLVPQTGLVLSEHEPVRILVTKAFVWCMNCGEVRRFVMVEDEWQCTVTIPGRSLVNEAPLIS